MLKIEELEINMKELTKFKIMKNSDEKEMRSMKKNTDKKVKGQRKRSQTQVGSN